MENNLNEILSKDLKQNLSSQGFKKFTLIQERAVPSILKGNDVIAKAKTGSGKTLCFSIGAVENLDVKNFKVQTLILSPTRELSNQIANELKKVARYKANTKILTLCGGTPSRPQKHSLKHGAHIIVGTVGRVLFHLKEGTLDVSDLNIFVLDEADKMLDMGFSEDIEKINSFLPKKKQTLLFSATYEENVQALSKNIVKKDAHYIFAEQNLEKKDIKEYFVEANTQNKYKTLKLVINKFKPNSLLIFCNTKLECDKLEELLEKYMPLVLHSDFEQKSRDEIITLYENGSYPFLIATDVASRGLHIDDIDLVINFDLPRDKQTYTHRIGRTARASKKGTAVTIFEENQKQYLDEIKDENEINFLDISTYEKEEYNLAFDLKSIYISGGKKLKLRAGDILGSLIQAEGLKKEEIGKITIYDRCSYVALKKEAWEKLIKSKKSIKIKTKDFRIYPR